MPEFVYVSLDSSGNRSTGVVSAANSAAAALELKAQGVFALDVRPRRKEGKAGGKGLLDQEIDLAALGLGGPKAGDVALFFRQLSVLLESGVSLMRSIEVLSGQAHKAAMRKLLERVAERLREGVPFSAALAREKRAFGGPVIRLLEAAELSGEMDLIMRRVAAQLESRQEFRRKMVSSMIYPVMVVVMAGVAIFVMTVVVVPKFAPMLKGGKGLPASTQLVMDFSAWTQANVRNLAAGLAALPAALWLARRSALVGKAMDRLLLRLPLVGSIVRCGVVVTLCRTLATMYVSGVPLVEALRTVRGTLANTAAAAVVDAMIEHVLDGGRMSVPLLQSRAVFPPMAGEMISMGEESGEMERVLNLTADIHENLLEVMVKRMNAAIEPALIVVLGGIVGFVMYALISGMLAVYGA